VEKSSGSGPDRIIVYEVPKTKLKQNCGSGRLRNRHRWLQLGARRSATATAVGGASRETSWPPPAHSPKNSGGPRNPKGGGPPPQGRGRGGHPRGRSSSTFRAGAHDRNHCAKRRYPTRTDDPYAPARWRAEPHAAGTGTRPLANERGLREQRPKRSALSGAGLPQSGLFPIGKPWIRPLGSGPFG